MKFLTKEILKDIGISLLIVIAIALLVMVIFYNKISIGRVIPNVQEYALTEEIEEEVEKEKNDEDLEIIKTYELKASELKQYEKTKEYNKGKKNPFSVDNSSSKKKSDNNNNNNSTNEGDTDTEDTSSSGNYYKDDGTK